MKGTTGADEQINPIYGHKRRSKQLESFWAVFEGDHEMAVEISTMFCSYIPEIFDEIEEAISQGNKSTLKKSLHKLKGSIGYLGFIDECELVEKHEKYFDDNNLDDAKVRLAPIKEKLFSLIEVIKKEVLEKN